MQKTCFIIVFGLKTRMFLFINIIIVNVASKYMYETFDREVVWVQIFNKKGKRKVQGVPQSQTAALFRPQEEEETDKSKQAQTEKTYEKH